MCLTETWLTGSSSDDVTIGDIQSSLQGYSVISVPRTSRRGGGLALISRKTFKTKITKSQVFNTFEHVELSVTSGSDVLKLLLIYRPPASQKTGYFSEFLDEFASLLEITSLCASHLVLVGDFNLHVDDFTSREATEFIELLQSYNLRQHVSGSTHHCGHTLDLVISRSDDNIVQSVSLFNDLPSDHCAVMCSMLVKRPLPHREVVTFRPLRRLDVDLFSRDILESTLHQDLKSPSLADNYYTTLHQLLDKHAPPKTKVVTVRPQSPWFTEELHECKLCKRRAERQWKSSGLEVHRLIFQDKCREYINMLNEVKEQYFRDKISATDTRGLFRLINHNFGRSGQKALPSDADGEHFSSYFTQKIRTIRHDIDLKLSTTTSSIHLDDDTCQVSLSTWEPVSLDVVSKTIKRSACKSSQLDPIPAWLFTSCLTSLLPVITSIINTSLETGVVPQCFKHAHVSPLIKKVSLDPETLSNYRPVSNLPYVSKCLERVVAAQLHTYLEKHKLYDDRQSAYRPNHSTETTLLRIYNDILMAADCGTEVVLLMLDLSAAFDTIDHEILLLRLRQRYGIEGRVLQWFTSYLENRTQSVVLPGSTSSTSNLSWGVPQGSVLGPVLFSLYMAPLGDLIASFGIDYLCYADDTQMYVRLSSESALHDLQACVADIRTWMLANKLKLNDSKSELIKFTSHFWTASQLPPVYVGDSQVELSNSVRDLGVILDDCLSMDSHVQRLCSSAVVGLRSIGRIRNYLDQQSCKKLVNAFVVSKLDYCNSLLCGLPSKQLDRIQRIQNNAARVVTCSRKYDHITPVLHQLHWLPIRQRINFKLLLTTFKVLHNGSPTYLKTLLTEPPSRSLRSSSGHHLFIPRVKTKAYGERAFCYLAPKLWNSLPNEIRTMDSVASFKSVLKTYLFRTAFEN